MSEIGLIALLAGLVFAIRISGLFSSEMALPDVFERGLRFAPMAVIAALTASLLSGQASGDPLRYLAAAGAGLVMLWSRRIWLSLLSGFCVYWAVRLFAG